MIAGSAAVAVAGPLTPFAYVSGDQDVSVINTSTNAIVATVPGSCNGSVAVAPDGRFAYVECNGSIQVISTSTNTVVATVSDVGAGRTGPNAMAITPDGAFAYVSHLDEETCP